MRLLLDTHFLVWLTEHPHRLDDAERALIFNSSEPVNVSAASIWEIRLKWQSVYKSGQRKIETPPAAALKLIESLKFRLLEITGAVAAAVLREPIAHRDPFDELLLIQAQQEGLRLLTRDRLLIDHPLALVAAR